MKQIRIKLNVVLYSVTTLRFRAKMQIKQGLFYFSSFIGMLNYDRNFGEKQ